MIDASPQPDPPAPAQADKDRDNALLSALLDGSRPLAHIAADLGLSILQLLDLIEQPHIQDALARLARVAHTRTQVITRLARPAAAQALADLINPGASASSTTSITPVSPESPLEAIRHNETVRRAASQILAFGRPNREEPAMTSSQDKRRLASRALRWTPWRPFPIPAKGQLLIAPMGPGLYEPPNRRTGQLIPFGRAQIVAWRMTSLLPKEAGGQGMCRNQAKRNDLARNLKNIEYRTKPSPTRDQSVLEERMLKQNAASCRFPTRTLARRSATWRACAHRTRCSRPRLVRDS